MYCSWLCPAMPSSYWRYLTPQWGKEPDFIFINAPRQKGKIGLCHSMRLFHRHRVMKIQPCSPVLSLAESTAKAFCRLFLWSFKGKSINHFLWHSQKIFSFSYSTSFSKPIYRDGPCGGFRWNDERSGLFADGWAWLWGGGRSDGEHFI